MATLAEMIAEAIAEHERVWHSPISADSIDGEVWSQEEWDQMVKSGRAVDFSVIREELTKQQMNADIITIGV
jgi:hypothetical protein